MVRGSQHGGLDHTNPYRVISLLADRRLERKEVNIRELEEKWEEEDVIFISLTGFNGISKFFLHMFAIGLFFSFNFSKMMTS